MIETKEGSDFVSRIFTNLLNSINIKRYSRNSSLKGVFAKRHNLSNRDLLKKPVFDNGEGMWVNVLPTITTQEIYSKRSSNKLTPIQAALIPFEKFLYHNFLDKRKKPKPNYKIGDLVRTTDLKKTFSKRDSTN